MRKFNLNSSVMMGPEGAGGGGAPAGGAAASSSSSTPSPAPSSTGSSSSSGSPPTPDPGNPSSGQAESTGGELQAFETIFEPTLLEGSTPAEPAKPDQKPQEPQPQVPPKPETPPAPGTAPAQPQEPRVEAKPTGQPAPTEGAASPQEQKPPLDPLDPSALLQSLQQNEAQTVEHLASTMFKLSSEDLEALEADVAGTVPKLLARTFLQSSKNLLAQLGRIVPAMIERHGAATQRNSEAEAEFYSHWDSKGLKLDRNAHGKVVRDTAILYRKMYPSATKEQMFAELGPIIAMKAGLTMQTVAPSKGAPAMVPANGSRPPQASPFVPAQGAPSAMVEPQQQEAWEAMFNPPPDTP